VYTNFWGFQKYRVLAQTLKGLTFDFFEKRLFTAKTSQKLIFDTRDAHVLARSYIMVLYTIFLRFLKISSFGSTHKGVSLRCCFLKNVYSWWKQVENLYFIPMGTIFLLCSTQIFICFENYWVSSQNPKG
jgi:hypothetical protein